MKTIGLFTAMAKVEEERQLAVAENFDRMWREKYPHAVSTLGTSSPRPEYVEERLGVKCWRMPIPALGFSLWGFESAADADRFLGSFPDLVRRKSEQRR